MDHLYNNCQGGIFFSLYLTPIFYRNAKMTVTFWALSLAFLIFHPIASSPSVLVSDDTLPECPDGCECRQDFRIAECMGADPYLALQILSVHAVESLILSECYISYELWNETLTDISFNHLSSLRKRLQ